MSTPIICMLFTIMFSPTLSSTLDILVHGLNKADSYDIDLENPWLFHARVVQGTMSQPYVPDCKSYG